MEDKLNNEEVVNPKIQDIQESPFKGLGISDAFKSALRDESLIAGNLMNAYRNSQAESFTPDETFDDKQKEELFKAHVDDIDKSYVKWLNENSHSKEEYDYNVEMLKKDTIKKRYLDSYGLGNFFITGAAIATDIPAFILGTTAASTVAPVAMGAAASTFIGRTLLGATGELIYTAAKDFTLTKDQTALDYTLNPILAGGITGLFGKDAIVTNASIRAFERQADAEGLNKKLAKAATEEDKLIITKEHIQNQLNKKKFDMNPKFTDLVDGLESSVKKGKFDKNIFNQLRMDTAYLMGKSSSETISKIADEAFIDGTLQKNEANKVTAAEMQQQVEDSLINNMNFIFKETVLKYGKKKYGKDALSARFSTVVDEVSNVAGTMQRKRNLYKISDEEAINEGVKILTKEGLGIDDATELATDILANLKKDALDSHKILKESGKKGFADGVDGTENIKPDDTYMTIQYDRNMARKLNDKGMNQNHLKQFILGSLKSKLKQNGIDEDMLTEEMLNNLDLMSDGLTKSIWKNQDTGAKLSGTESFDTVLANLIKEDPDRYGSIAKNLGIKGSDDAVVFTRERSPFDYSYRQTFIIKGKDVDLSFEDLVKNDYFATKNMYSRKMGGGVALERIGIDITEVNPRTRGIAFDLGRVISKASRESVDDTVMGQRLYESQDDVDDAVGLYFDDAVRELGLENIADKETLNTLKNIVKDLSIRDDERLKALTRVVAKGMKEIGSDGVRELSKLANELAADYKALASSIHNVLKPNKDLVFGTKEYDEAFSDLFQRSAYKVLDDKFKAKIDEAGTATKRYTMDTEEGYRKIRDKVFNELIDAGKTDRQINTELSRLDELRNEWLGKPTARGANTTAGQLEKIGRNANIARLLGQTGYTMFAEVGSVLNHVGVKNLIDYTMLGSVIKQFRTGHVGDELTQEIMTHMGLSDALLRDIGINRYDHLYDATDDVMTKFEGRLNKIERFSEKAAEATMLFGGIKPLTAWMEGVMARDTVNKLMVTFQKGNFTKRELADLNELGVNKEMLDRFKNQFDKYGKSNDKGQVTGLGYEKWDDIEAKQMFTASVRRITNTIIQKSHIGDKIGIMDPTQSNNAFLRNGLLGRTALQLTDYIITSYTKQLGRAVTRRDAYVAAMIATQAAMLSLATTIQNVNNYAGNPEKMEKAFDTVNFMRTVASRMPVASYAPTLVDAVATPFIGEGVFAQTRYGDPLSSAFNSIPSFDLARKMYTVGTAPFEFTGKTIMGKEYDQNKFINAAFGLAPMGNWYLTKPIKEAIIAE